MYTENRVRSISVMRMCSLRLIEPFREIEFPFSFEIKNKFSNSVWAKVEYYIQMLTIIAKMNFQIL